MIFLDTSFLYAFLVEHDPHHDKAIEHGNVLNQAGVYMPRVVFEELMTILNQRVSTERAVEIGKKLLAHEWGGPVMRADENLFDEIWKKFCEHKSHGLSFADCTLLVMAEHFDAKILTFDEELDRLAA